MVDLLGPDRPIEEITFFDGEGLKETLRAEGLKAVTVNMYLQDLKRLFTVQLATRVIKYHPFGVSRGVKVPQSERIKHRILSFDEIEMVLAEAEKNDLRIETDKDNPGNPPLLGRKLTLFLLLFLGCGIRRGEAMAAKWENVDWQRRKLHLIETKTNEPRDVGLGERLFGHLRSMAEREGQGEIISCPGIIRDLSRGLSEGSLIGVGCPMSDSMTPGILSSPGCSTLAFQSGM